jgi:DNA replication protein DnaC
MFCSSECEKASNEKRRAQREAEQEKYDEDQRERWIIEELPASFRKLEIIPASISKDDIRAAYEWFSKRRLSGDVRPNLYLHGGTGNGKTYLGLSILKSATLYYTGKQIATGAIARVDGMTFQREIPARLMRDKDDDDTGSLEDFVGPLRDAGILFFDEVDKLTGSNRVSLEFFALLNDRIERDVMTIIASYAPPVEVVKLFERSGDGMLGVQIARRIADFFQIIHMKGQQ